MIILVEILGCCAGVLTSVAYIPQIHKLLKTKESVSISITAYVCTFIGCFLWLIYGLINQSIALILFNILNIGTSIIIIYLSYKYARRVNQAKILQHSDFSQSDVEKLA